jgi:GNAT superfamily N-acetyltransferase
MRLKIKPIEKNGFLELFSKAPAIDRKWLIYLFHNLKTSPKYYIVEDGFTKEIIGFTYCILLDGQLDFSLIIFPKFQRQGFGKDLITHIHENFENASFTVSKSNIRMLSLMNKISLSYRLTAQNLGLNRVLFKIR